MSTDAYETYQALLPPTHFADLALPDVCDIMSAAPVVDSPVASPVAPPPNTDQTVEAVVSAYNASRGATSTSAHLACLGTAASVAGAAINKLRFNKSTPLAAQHALATTNATALAAAGPSRRPTPAPVHYDECAKCFKAIATTDRYSTSERSGGKPYDCNHVFCFVCLAAATSDDPWPSRCTGTIGDAETRCPGVKSFAFACEHPDIKFVSRRACALDSEHKTTMAYLESPLRRSSTTKRPMDDEESMPAPSKSVSPKKTKTQDIKEPQAVVAIPTQHTKTFKKTSTKIPDATEDLKEMAALILSTTIVAPKRIASSDTEEEPSIKKAKGKSKKIVHFEEVVELAGTSASHNCTICKASSNTLAEHHYHLKSAHGIHFLADLVDQHSAIQRANQQHRGDLQQTIADLKRDLEASMSQLATIEETQASQLSCLIQEFASKDQWVKLLLRL